MCNELAQVIEEGLAGVAIVRKLSKVMAVLGMDTTEAGGLVGAGAVGKDNMKVFA